MNGPSRLWRAVLALVVGLVGSVMVSSYAEAAETCPGRWAPSNGKFIESYNPQANTFSASIYFSFTPAEAGVLQCWAYYTNQKGYEVDMMALGTIPASGGQKTL